LDKKAGKKRRWNIGTAQPAYDGLKNSNRSDKQKEEGQKSPSMKRLQRKRLLKNGKLYN